VLLSHPASAAIDGIDKKGNDKKSTNLGGGASLNENESFNRHYNKELKVSEGMPPLIIRLYR
jgi:hypothetical protein